MKRSISAVFGLLSGIIVTGQSLKQPLGVDEAVAAAVKANHAVQQAGIDQQLAETRYRQSAAMYMPQVGISFTAVSTNNPLNAFGMKLQQKMITQADFNPVLLNNPGATPDFSTRFEVQQPLINLDLYYQRKAAGAQAGMYQLMGKRTEEYVSWETRKAYLQLQMAHQAFAVLNEAHQTAQAVYQSASNYFKQGMIQQSDLLSVQVFVSDIEMKMTQVKAQIGNASDFLSLLMGKQPGIEYHTDSLQYILESRKLTADSLPEKRADFMAMQKGLEAYDQLIKSEKMRFLPRLNAFGQYQLNDNRMLGFGAGAYLAGVQLSWDLFKGNRTKEELHIRQLEKQQLQNKLQQEKDQSKLGINQALRNAEEAAASIRKYDVAIQQAAEALRITRNRYAQGLATTNDILMAQTRYSEQQLGRTQAIFNHNMAMLTLRFQTTVQP